MTPTFSIIIATYNAEKVICKTLDSLKYLDKKSYELIIVDGKSSDNTCEIINKKIKEVDFFISETDNGIYDAWNKGIKLSKNEWIIFLGAGDEVNKNLLKEYSNIINQNPVIEFISTKAFLTRDKVVVKEIGESWNWKAFSKFMNICHVGSAHKKTMFMKKGAFNDKYKIAGDYEFLLRFGSSLKSAFIDKTLITMPNDGISNSNFNVFKESYNAQIDNGINKLKASLFYFYGVFVFLIKRGN